MIARRGLSVLAALVVITSGCLLSACEQAEPTATEAPTAVSVTEPFVSPLQPDAEFEGALAFHSDRSGVLQIHVMRGDTLAETRLTEDPGGAFEPSWSPGCSSIAFASKRMDPNAFELFTMLSDGSEQTILRQNQPADDWSPAWSPLGDTIAYQTNQSGRLDVCFMTPDGEPLGCLEGDYAKASPSWAPDGSKLLFVGDRDGDWDVYLTDYPASSEPVQLTENNVPDANPRFALDAKTIAFASKQVGNFDIFRMDDDGSNEVQLTFEGEDDVTPYWVGSDRIAFASRRTSDWELYLMEADGTNQVQLTFSKGLDKWPVWCPGE
jgi:TolB protein